MDARDFAIFYPHLAAELRHIEVDAMPGWAKTPPGLRSAGHVLEVAVLFAAVTVCLVIGLTRWDWAARVRSLRRCAG